MPNLPLNAVDKVATLEPRQALVDKVTLLQLQNHHLNERLIDHVKIEAARTDQIAGVIYENELLRDELAELMERVECLEHVQQESTPSLPDAFYVGLPVRRSPSPAAGPSRLSIKRSFTSLGVRSISRQSIVPSRPQTSHALTAPFKTRSTSHPNIFSTDNNLCTDEAEVSYDIPAPLSPPPVTLTFNLLPPTPAPPRAQRSSIDTERRLLSFVLSSLSERSQSSMPMTASLHSDVITTDEASASSSPAQTANSPIDFTQRIMRRSGEEAESCSSHPDALQGLLSELDDVNDEVESTGFSSQGLLSPIDFHLSVQIEHNSATAETDEDGDDSDLTSDEDSMVEVESLVAPRSNRSSVYTHSKRDSNLPEPQDMIFHLTQMMRTERKEREEEKAQWELEKRALLEKCIAGSGSAPECLCQNLARDQAGAIPPDIKLAPAPVYDFLKPWTYPLPTQTTLDDIDERLRQLMSQALELVQEKRLFKGLAEDMGGVEDNLMV